MKKRIKSTSWGRVAKWYSNKIEEKDSFQQKVILPNMLRQMQIKHGEEVLDIACGSGFFSRAFFEKGANICGTDISPELIDLCRKNSPEKIIFQVADAVKQPCKTASIDKAVIILALQNIEDIKKVFVEVKRVLKPNGKFYIVINHPAFRIPQASSWEFISHKIQYRRVDRYLSEFSVRIKMHPGDNPKEVTTTFHRPLESYIKSLTSCGFVITGMQEWISHKISTDGPRAVAENIARKEIPMFLFIEAKNVYNI